MQLPVAFNISIYTLAPTARELREGSEWVKRRITVVVIFFVSNGGLEDVARSVPSLGGVSP